MKTIIITIAVLLTLNSCEDPYRKGSKGIKHEIYQPEGNRYYAVEDLVYDNGCAKFKGITQMDDKPRDIIICGSFVQLY